MLWLAVYVCVDDAVFNVGLDVSYVNRTIVQRVPIQILLLVLTSLCTAHLHRLW